MALHKIPSCYSVKYSHMCSGVIWKTVFTEHSVTLHQEIPLESLLRKEMLYISSMWRCRRVLWAWAHLRWPRRKWKCLLFGTKWNRVQSIQTNKTFTSDRCKSKHLSWYWGTSLQTVWVTCNIVKVPLTWRHTFGLYRDINCP